MKPRSPRLTSRAGHADPLGRSIARAYTGDSVLECQFSPFPRDAECPRARMPARATRVAIGRSGARVERRLSNILSTSFNIFVVRHGIGANASAHHEHDTPVAWVVVMIDDAARREPTERASDGRRMNGRVVKM